MRIYKFANILSIPFALMTVGFLSLLLTNHHDKTAMWAVVPLAALILIYLFQPQIDYWWLSRHPIELDENVRKLINRTNWFYRNLNDDQKQEFDKRMLLYVNGNAFSAKGMETDADVPFDIKYMIAQIPVTLSFNNNPKLFKNYERIIIYKHAFPSPAFKFLHTVETHHEDGAVIFSIEHAEAAFFNPEKFYNVAWHVFCEAFVYIKKIKLDDVGQEEELWRKLSIVFGFDKDFILKTIGFNNTQLSTVLLVAYFTRNEALRDTMPNMYDVISEITGFTST